MKKTIKKSCNLFSPVIYYRGLLIAVKREVAELSGNFRGELSPPDGGEGH